MILSIRHQLIIKRTNKKRLKHTRHIQPIKLNAQSMPNLEHFPKYDVQLLLRTNIPLKNKILRTK